MAAHRTRLGRAAALSCAAALAALAGCGGPAAPRPADDDRAVQAVLDTRARAVLHHDRSAFLGTVDPAAAAFRDAQRQVFDRLAAVPLASWSYRLAGTGAFPLAPAADGTRRLAARVELAYRLRGYDAAPVTSTLYATADLRGGRWYLASFTDGDPAGKRSTDQPWDLGPVTVVRGTRSLVLGSGTPARLRVYARLADRAVPAVQAVWGTGWPGRAVVEVPASQQAMASLLGAGRDGAAAYQGIAAVTWTELPGTGAPADRVIINPRAFGELGAVGRQVVLTHEITHVATSSATTSATPLWLVEGFADWVGYRTTGLAPRQVAPELAGDVAAGRLPARLPSDADFGTTRAGLAQAYEGAWLACRMVAEQWGQDALVRLYRDAGRQGADAALRGTLGVDLPAFTARWRAYTAKELR